MATAVMPHTRPAETDLNTKPAPVRDAFLDLIDIANAAADNHNLGVYRDLHARAAAILGIQKPATGELAICTCTACFCQMVFDADLALCTSDGPGETVQCPACADDHRASAD